MNKKIENWVSVTAALVGTLGLFWVAHTALYVDNDFQVYTIMIWGSGVATSLLFRILARVLSLTNKEGDSQ